MADKKKFKELSLKPDGKKSSFGGVTIQKQPMGVFIDTKEDVAASSGSPKTEWNSSAAVKEREQAVGKAANMDSVLEASCETGLPPGPIPNQFNTGPFGQYSAMMANFRKRWMNRS